MEKANALYQNVGGHTARTILVQIEEMEILGFILIEFVLSAIGWRFRL
jgi:hypothetical protein